MIVPIIIGTIALGTIYYANTRIKKRKEQEKIIKEIEEAQEEERRMREWEEQRKREQEQTLLRIKREQAMAEKLNPFASSLKKKIIKETTGRYINHRLYLKVFSKYRASFAKIRAYKGYMYTKHSFLFDFFQNPDVCDAINKTYIEKMQKKHAKYFEKINGNKLTEKQLEAVVSEEDATLVNAGAGTGKTKTIESKLLYLVKHKKIPLKKILVMTYAKDAEMDMMKRIKETLDKAKIKYNDDDLKETISTFHSFGKKIIDEYMLSKDKKKNGKKKKNIKKIGKGVSGLKVMDKEERRQIMCDSIKNIQQESLLQKLISVFILQYGAPQVEISRFKTLDEYYKYSKGLFKTLLKKGEYTVVVKSYGEFLIANFLWLNNIDVEYEPKGHYYINRKGKKWYYYPDFYLPKYNVYIEYFGLDKDGNTAPDVPNKEYTKNVENKINNHRESNNKFIDIRYADLQDGGPDHFLNVLKENLKKYGIPTTPKKNNKVIEVCEVSGKLFGITNLLESFLVLYKEADITIDEIDKKLSGGFDLINKFRNKTFLKIFKAFLEEYTKISKERGYMDFGDMIKESVGLIYKEKIKRKFNYILVDEFQDITNARAGMIQAVREKNNDCRLFCVGDDWQSIYQFAGSDINIFLKFDEYFGYYKYLILDKTFRFNQGISNISGGFVMMNHDQKVKKIISNDKKNDGRVEIVQKDNQEYLESVLADILKDSPKKKKIDVFLITRYGSSKYDDFDGINNILGMKKITKGEYEYTYLKQKIHLKHMTIHNAKGSEADYVIVDYVNQGCKYDFPSGWEDDPILSILKNNNEKEYPFAEERRIFYVSMTRGKHKAYIVCKKGNESQFVYDLIKIDKKNNQGVLINKCGLSEDVDNHERCRYCGGRLFQDKFREDMLYCENHRQSKCPKVRKKVS